MKQILKRFSITFLIIFALAAIAYMAFNEKRPQGTPSPEADSLAQKMLAAVGKAGWDSTRYVSWNYSERNSIVWDKTANQAEVKWKDKRALLKPDESYGIAFGEDAQKLEGPKAEKVLDAAWKIFYNDGFWLNAPVKVFDPGTSRSLITLEDGKQGLLVSYASGGATPGDAYLWILDEKYKPVKWKMWVQILPLGGIESTWDEWETLPSGAMIACKHLVGGVFTTTIKNLKTGQTLAEIGLVQNPFKEFEK